MSLSVLRSSAVKTTDPFRVNIKLPVLRVVVDPSSGKGFGDGQQLCGEGHLERREEWACGFYWELLLSGFSFSYISCRSWGYLPD